MTRQHSTMNVIDLDMTQQARLQREAHDWLLRLTSGEATEEDAHAFKDWCARSPAHRRTFAESRRLWQLIGDAAALESAPRGEYGAAHKGEHDAAQENAHCAAQKGTPAPAGRFSRRVFLRRAMLGSAAACAGWMVLGPGRDSWWPADFETAVGEQRSVQLADVAVEMNTGTRLNVDASMAEMTRLELLAGEAEIRARNTGRQVMLSVQGGNVLATAANFNVRLDQRGACVTCLSGALVVGYRGATRTLVANQQLVLGARQLSEIHPADPALVSAWRQQLLVFNDEPLSRVIAEINRYRPGRLIITNDALGRRRVQARFTLDQLPDVALLIRDAYGASITRIPGNVILLG